MARTPLSRRRVLAGAAGAAVAVVASRAEADSHATGGSTDHRHDASATDVVPTTTLAATTVQSALEELDAEKASLAAPNAFTEPQTIRHVTLDGVDGSTNLDVLQIAPVGTDKYSFVYVVANGTPRDGELGYAVAARGAAGTPDYEGVELLYDRTSDLYRIFITGDGTGRPKSLEIRAEDDAAGGALMTRWQYAGGLRWRLDHFVDQRMAATTDSAAAGPSRGVAFEANTFNGSISARRIVTIRAEAEARTGTRPYRLVVADDDGRPVVSVGARGYPALDVQLPPQSSAVDLPSLLVRPVTVTLTSPVAKAYSVGFNEPTYASTTEWTIDTAATVHIGGAPRAGDKVILARRYALWVDNGSTRLDGYLGLGVLDPEDWLHLIDGGNVVVGTRTGTRIGTSGAAKLAFWGATPVAQRTGTPPAATDLQSATALVNDLRQKLLDTGIVA